MIAPDYDSFMAIRFQCASCAQPIEVDDEWAGKLVACPYCRKTVVAPAASTLAEQAHVPTASAVGEFRALPPRVGPNGAGASAGDMATGAAAMEAPVTNVSAVIAFVLSTLVVILMLIVVLIEMAHPLELRELAEAFEKGGPDFSGKMTAFQQFMDKERASGIGWIIAITALQFAYLAAALAAIIFGIIGLARRPKRGLAIASLVISGGVLSLMCISLVAGFL